MRFFLSLHNRLGRRTRFERRSNRRRPRVESLEERRFLSGDGLTILFPTGEALDDGEPPALEWLPWQNSLRPLDVNDDTLIVPGDSLQILNELNAHGPRRFSTSELPGDDPHPFYDTNGDQYLGPIDALWVINYLNAVTSDEPVDPPMEFAAPEVLAVGSADLKVDAYSVPLCKDMNRDTLPDLLVGEKTDDGPGKIRFYPNTGTATAPEFENFSYLQANGADLEMPASGCLGACPRLFDFNGDGWPDLLVGLADGTVRAYPSQVVFSGPAYDAYETLEVGYPEEKTPIDVGDRAAVEVVDWDDDGRDDLLVGGLDGRVRLYRDTASTGPADFRTEQILPAGTSDLIVSSGRAAVAAADLNRDGLFDLLLGNTAGELICYFNVGQRGTPWFRDGQILQIDETPIDLDGDPRSRPFLGDLNGDGRLDILLGSQDGKIRVYEGQAAAGSTGETSNDDIPDYGCG